MRTQMLTAQSDDIRRQIFERFAGPILDTLLPTIRSYFEQVYRIRPVLSRAEQVIMLVPSSLRSPSCLAGQLSSIVPPSQLLYSLRQQ